jgi:hypothetical protein
MAVKYADKKALKHFRERLEGIFLTEQEVIEILNRLLTEYRQGIITVVRELPTKGEEGFLYLIPSSTDDVIYIAFAWENNEWVQMGSATLDLSDYVTKGELKAHSDNAKVHITEAERTYWNNKLNADDLVALTDSEIDSIMV